MPKLVSFMAPVPNADDDFLADELFANLFGKPAAAAASASSS